MQASSAPPKILVAICSAIQYRTRRDAVRQTWLTQPGPGVTSFFFIGQGAAPQDEPDVVVLPVSDAYDDLPAKIRSVFAYALAHHDFDWLFKCDDDTYVRLSHLHELTQGAHDLVGNDEFLNKRGYASGGAGYMLSRRYVSLLAGDNELPETGCEDILITQAALHRGAVPLPSSRLNWTSHPSPAVDNDLITAHWCAPQKLRSIHTRLHEEPERHLEATHPYWRDTLTFYRSGLFLRQGTGCCGEWTQRENGRLSLRWFDWEEEEGRLASSGEPPSHPRLEITKLAVPPRMWPSAVRHVVVELMGGLGNQMFQYAAGFAIAHDLGAELHLKFIGWDRPYMLGLFGLQLSADPPEGKLFHDESSYTPSLEERLLEAIVGSGAETVTLRGYFQNERCFARVADLIRQQFAITPSLPKGCEGQLPVAVHVRRGDYVGGGSHDVCSLAYFRSAMQLVAGWLEEPHFLVFSDDPSWCQEQMGHWPDVTVLGPHPEAETYQAMAACQAFIISNSTFSWWAAWLGQSAVVIRPSRCLNDRPWDLWPERWISLPAEGLPDPPKLRKARRRSSPEVGFVILNHDKPERLQRLVRALHLAYDEPSIVCHHDMDQCELSDDLFPENFAFVSPHIPSAWGSFSLVEATLAGLERVLSQDPAWIFLVSGSDYPVRQGGDVIKELRGSGYDAWLHLEPIRPPIFERPWQEVCYKRYFREGVFPFGLECYAGSQWMTLSAATARYLLQSHAERPELAEYYRGCSVPDESYFHTVLGNAPHLRLCRDNRRYIDWESPVRVGPKVLTVEDYERVVQSGAHFARKFDLELDALILEQLDARVFGMGVGS